MTVSHFAALLDRKVVLQFLDRFGADFNILNRWGNSPLYYASTNWRCEDVTLYLRNHNMVDQSFPSRTEALKTDLGNLIESASEWLRPKPKSLTPNATENDHQLDTSWRDYIKEKAKQNWQALNPSYASRAPGADDTSSMSSYCVSTNNSNTSINFHQKLKALMGGSLKSIPESSTSSCQESVSGISVAISDTSKFSDDTSMYAESIKSSGLSSADDKSVISDGGPVSSGYAASSIISSAASSSVVSELSQ